MCYFRLLCKRSRVDVSKQLVFDLKDFMTLINSDWFKAKKIKQIIFDEPQTSISNRQWQSLANRLFNYLVTTFRHQNCIVLFCCPYRDFLDSASMKMIHCITEMQGINRKKCLVKTRPKLQQYNSKLRKTYEHSIYVIRSNGVNKMIYDHISKPPIHLVDTYEEMKTEFTSKLNKEIENQLEAMDKKENPTDTEQSIDTRKPLTTKQRNILILYKELGQVQLVAQRLGLSNATISKQIKLSRNKGHTPENVALSPIDPN